MKNSVYDHQNKHIYDQAISQYGISAQVDMLIEEMAELMMALLHDRRGRETNIPEEIADVQIMLEQIIQFFKIENAVKEQKDRKIMRLSERLNMKEPQKTIPE